MRVYSVNPDLNHDECMTLLATAGIYLVLDVNSPRPGEALNRYEPWSTYNSYYLDHVMRIVHQFAGYNNTLGFFAGNEVINDEISAKESPHYIKAIIRDMHAYMKLHSPRVVPIGYSAADDLRYRISLAKYLECGEPGTHVDFYGVNSYQWCGYQNFQTSGYDGLVSDYSDYTLPIFLSEYGCNAVTPRVFQEVEPLYSPLMTHVFAGGLIYEYAQEANNYGLVDIDRDGAAHMLEDFDTLKREYHSLETFYDFSKEKNQERPVKCKGSYAHIQSTKALPDSPIQATIQVGINMPMGSFVNLRMNSTLHNVFDSKNNQIMDRHISKTMDWKTPIEATREWKSNAELVRLPLTKENEAAAPNAGRGLKQDSTTNEKHSTDKSKSKASRKNKANALEDKDATSSSVNVMFNDLSAKLLFWAFIVGGPIAGFFWIGTL